MADFDPEAGLIMREAAREYSVPYSWLRGKVHDGEIRGMRVGKFMIINRDDLEEIAAEGQLLQKVLDARKRRAAERNKEEAAKKKRRKEDST